MLENYCGWFSVKFPSNTLSHSAYIQISASTQAAQHNKQNYSFVFIKHQQILKTIKWQKQDKGQKKREQER